MIQHHVSHNNIFINSAHELKYKQGKTQLHFVLSLKKTCVCFLNQKNSENICLKKPTSVFINKLNFLLIVLLIDFIILIKQKVFKKHCFTHKKTIRKEQSVSEKEGAFIKKTPVFFYNNKR